MFIRVKAYPQAKKEKLIQKGENHFEIYVKEKAERNQVNKKIQEILAKHFQKKENQIHIISGHKRSSKIIELRE